jgi:hypothetical protein
LQVASSTEIGGIQLGYTQSGKNYPVQLSSNKAYVNVPWANDNTTYSFTGGINKFTVTPSVGNAYDVAVTPSIDKNVTYTGTVSATVAAIPPVFTVVRPISAIASCQVAPAATLDNKIAASSVVIPNVCAKFSAVSAANKVPLALASLIIALTLAYLSITSAASKEIPACFAKFSAVIFPVKISVALAVAKI